MQRIWFWLYITNSVLIILHEMDSAFWQEWKLFKLPGGVSGFLLIHVPILFLLLFGTIQVYHATLAGRIISLLLSLGGIFAFSIHTYFIRRGREEFKTLVSMSILISTFIISILQLCLTVYFMII